jgi:hypothetical protein
MLLVKTENTEMWPVVKVIVGTSPKGRVLYIEMEARRGQGRRQASSRLAREAQTCRRILREGGQQAFRDYVASHAKGSSGGWPKIATSHHELHWVYDEVDLAFKLLVLMLFSHAEIQIYGLRTAMAMARGERLSVEGPEVGIRGVLGLMRADPTVGPAHGLLHALDIP